MNASIAKGHRREWLPFVWEDPGGPGSGHKEDGQGLGEGWEKDELFLS